MTLGVWLVRVDNLWVVGETVMQVARYPLEIYNPWLQRLFIYVIPLGLLATVPAMQVTRGGDWGLVALGVLWAAAAFLCSRLFWRRSMRSYTSASS